MFKRVFRIVVTLSGMLFGYGVANVLFVGSDAVFNVGMGTGESILVTGITIIIFGIIFSSLYASLSRQGERAVSRLELTISSTPLSEVMATLLGIIVGLLIAFLISQIINGIEALKTAYLNIIISVISYLILGSLGAQLGRTVSKQVGERLPLPSAVMQAPKETAAKSKGKQAGVPPKILDTSVIIDGRISDILKAGFLEGTIVIPDFVLGELQRLADSSDSMKRSKGRRGLDILAKLQTDYGLDIRDTSGDRSLDDIPEVDVKLIKLAMSIKGMVMTNDFNLNKVAAIQGIKVLNINELANALKPVVVPGETMRVFLIKEGKEPGQGVAYLDDGTMIVVEDGRGSVGKTVDITVTSVLQTSAGRMIFGRIRMIP